jgi:hypothetical protein
MDEIECEHGTLNGNIHHTRTFLSRTGETYTGRIGKINSWIKINLYLLFMNMDEFLCELASLKEHIHYVFLLGSGEKCTGNTKKSSS